MMLYLMRPRKFFNSKKTEPLTTKLLIESNAPSFSSHESSFYNQSKGVAKDSLFEDFNRISSDSFRSYTISNDITFFNKSDYYSLLVDSPPFKDYKSRSVTADDDSILFDQPVYGSPVNINACSMFGTPLANDTGPVNPMQEFLLDNDDV